MKTSANKLRSIVSWLDYQNEDLNYKFRSISDIEKAFDYCRKSQDVEFLDNQGLSILTRVEKEMVKKEVTELLGYSIF